MKKLFAFTSIIALVLSLLCLIEATHWDGTPNLGAMGAFLVCLGASYLYLHLYKTHVPKPSIRTRLYIADTIIAIVNESEELNGADFVDMVTTTMDHTGTYNPKY
jgi:hypothetical protein